MPKALRVLAYDLDSGEKVLFGAQGTAHVPVTRACIASMAVSPFFSPVRIGDRHYIDAGAAQVSLLDEAVAGGAEVIVVVNPMVPVRVDSVPTGHGPRGSIRDKGLLWVTNQSLRISIQALMSEACRRIEAEGRASVLMLEPNPSDGGLFMHNPANYEARRNILEHAYRATRSQLSGYIDRGHPALERAGWNRRG
jgi:predicted acylesterase/phospholipase RssA